MTGYDIYKRALSISGYLNDGIVLGDDGVLIEKVPDIINQIALDLKIPEINDIEQNVNATPEQFDAACYGVAMLLAIKDRDSDKSRLFTQIYNSKRAAALSESGKIYDTLPSV